MADAPKDWKLQLRYGRLKTPFHHYTALADGEVKTAHEGFGTRAGSAAWFGFKCWATDTEMATDMAHVIGREVGFDVTGRTYIYDAEPDEPPRDQPFAYGLNFTPYERD